VQPLSTHMLSSGDLIADRRFEWARACEAKGDLAAAAELLAQALERTPGYASAWFALGEIREKLGDRAGTIAAFRQAQAADPDDRHGATLHLIRLGAESARGMPTFYVRALFDHYASAFDQALDGLSYRAPDLLLRAVTAARGQTGQTMRFESVLDLGCGTGLAGATFRPFADRLIGVDLSPGMLAQARAKALYDRLIEGEVLECLAAEAAAATRYQLILAADVFMYLDDLAPVAQAAARLLAADGLFAFSVETHAGAGVLLRETLRYAHGAAHVRAALAVAGLQTISLESAATRTEKALAVPGLVVVAGR